MLHGRPLFFINYPNTFSQKYFEKRGKIYID